MARGPSKPALLGHLAASAERLDFQRTAYQGELPQTGSTFEELVHFRYLDILNAPAANANDMMMRLDVAVVTRGIMQKRYLARLADLAEFLQNPMHGRQRDMGMAAADSRIDLVGARMVFRGEQNLNYREALGRDCKAPLATSGDEFAESLHGVPLAPLSIQ
jgi:hypothetical protein